MDPVRRRAGGAAPGTNNQEETMSLDREHLRLHEEILLLALKDREGTFFMKTFNPALGGALVAELLLAERIAVPDENKKLVDLVSAEPLGVEILDECLERIRTAKRRAKLDAWVRRFGNISRLRHRIAAALCKEGILHEDEEQILLFFRRKTYPQVDPRPERVIVDRMRAAIFSDTHEIEPRTMILIALAKSADLLSVPFEKWQPDERKDRIERIAKGEMVGQAAEAATKAAQTAAFVATILPAVTISAATR
ncbi:MAG: hypothetical protein GF346_04070 [Candidatus Eisenbacteria bacterium]|nr:hypothetical protein [Candidatus Latescibacterota bacterium]MBD3301602.1 hypothetical protein [Candidatus Eisenbacteria bacterium]